MRKSWLPALALSLGWIGSTTAFGQYPNAYNNFGPSSFPVAQQPQMQSVLQSLPQVPQYQAQAQYGQPTQYQQQGSPYQLVGAQDGASGAVYGVPAGGNFHQIPPPVPMAHGDQPQPQPQLMQQAPMAAPGCTSCQSQPVQQYQAPVDYGYQQALAPNVSGCGQAPVSNMYAPGTMAAGPAYNGGNAYTGNYGGGFGGGALAGIGLGGRAGLPTGAKPWFFGAGALIFNRIDNHNVPLSFRDDSYNTDIITSQSARMGVTGGFEASIGRYFNCGKNAIQASYWGLYPTEQTQLNSRVIAGEYASRIPFGYMNMSGTPAAPGVPYAVGSWFDNAFAHELRRSSSYHNVEVNLLGFAVGGAARNFNMSTAGTMFSGIGGGGGRSGGACGYCGGAGCGACGGGCGTSSCGTSSKYATGPCCLTAPACGSRLSLSWLGGFRYFHFSDNLQYAASLDDGVINRSPDDLYYIVDTTNNLFGFQLGSRADYCVGKRVNLYGNGKVGIYNNRSRLLTRLGTDTENATLDDTRPPVNPNNGGEYDFDETKDNVAFLSELGAGVGLRFSPKWTGTVGYRAVVVSGVATSPDNIRQTFANYNDIIDYNTSSTLILHGLNVGALYNF